MPTSQERPPTSSPQRIIFTQMESTTEKQAHGKPKQRATCAFCNRPLAGVASNEHILPHWLLNEFGIRDKQISPTHFSSDGKLVGSRKHSLNSLVAGGVCMPCNNGWMSALESDAKPHLLRLFSNDVSVVTLEHTTRVLIARWAMKTALTLNLGSNFDKNIPASHYKRIGEDSLTLPPGVVAFAQNHRFNQDFYWLQGAVWDVTNPTGAVDANTIQYLVENSYKVGFQFRGLLVVVAFNPLSDYLFSMWRGIHVPLYPNSGPVAWYDRDDFPWNDSQNALCSFHWGLGLVRARDAGNTSQSSRRPMPKE